MAEYGAVVRWDELKHLAQGAMQPATLMAS